MHARMSPLQLRMLLDVFVSPAPINIEGERKEQFEYMIRDGLIEPRPKTVDYSYRVTDKGRAFIEALLTMPYPEKTATWRVKHDFEGTEDELEY